MNIKNNQFWFWGFIVLAALLISAVTTMGIRTYRFHILDSQYDTVRNYNNGQKVVNGQRGQKSKRSQRGMRKKFKFTKSQREFFRKERQQNQQKLCMIQNKQKTNQNKLFKEISKNEPDNDSIEIYKKAILKSNEEIIDETISHYEILKTRLNQEQMQLVKNHVSRRLKRNNR